MIYGRSGGSTKDKAMTDEIPEAIKEDNPDWRQAMNGPFKEEYWNAACKGIETWRA